MTKGIRKVYTVGGVRNLASLFIILLFLFIITGFGPSTSSVAGTKWECVGPADKGQILEYFKDNTWTFSLLSGKWILLDDGRIKMDYTSFGMTQTWFARIEGNKLNDKRLGNFIKAK